MKTIKIEVVITEEKIASAVKAQGFKNDSLHDQLEVLGIFQNLLYLQQQKLKTMKRIIK